jgi:hypothetical protein
MSWCVAVYAGRNGWASMHWLGAARKHPVRGAATSYELIKPSKNVQLFRDDQSGSFTANKSWTKSSTGIRPTSCRTRLQSATRTKSLCQIRGRLTKPSPHNFLKLPSQRKQPGSKHPPSSTRPVMVGGTAASNTANSMQLRKLRPPSDARNTAARGHQQWRTVPPDS